MVVLLLVRRWRSQAVLHPLCVAWPQLSQLVLRRGRLPTGLPRLTRIRPPGGIWARLESERFLGLWQVEAPDW